MKLLPMLVSKGLGSSNDPVSVATAMPDLVVVGVDDPVGRIVVDGMLDEESSCRRSSSIRGIDGGSLRSNNSSRGNMSPEP